MSRPMQIILGLVTLILVAAGSFYGGVLFGKEQATPALPAGFELPEGAIPPGDAGAGFGTRDQAGAAGRFAAQPGMLFGQIESIDGNTLVITTADDQQTQVQVTDTTLIEKNTSVSVAELESGETVIVSGSQNDDGSITARSVQVAPAGRLGGPFGNRSVQESPQ